MYIPITTSADGLLERQMSGGGFKSLYCPGGGKMSPKVNELLEEVKGIRI